MTKEEAIEKIKSWDFLDNDEKEALETLIPELKESEDERIRKELIEHIKSNCETGFILFQKFSPDDVIAWLEKQGEKPQVDGFDAELDALLKKYEHLSKKELQEPLELYLGVVRDDLDIVRENPTKHEGWVNIYKHEDDYTLSSEMLNTVEEARKYWNKNTVATIKIEWEEVQQ